MGDGRYRKEEEGRNEGLIVEAWLTPILPVTPLSSKKEVGAEGRSPDVNLK